MIDRKLNNISKTELPILLRACYEESGGDMEETVHSVETINLLLGVQRMKTLISSRDRRAKSKWSRGRNYMRIMEQIILR